MAMDPDIGKHPVEFYGHPYFDDSDEAEDAYENEICPYLDQKCKKRRKSNNEITIGTCTVGYRKRGQSEYTPHVICPHRFETDAIFKEIPPLFTDEGELFRVPEVSLLGTSIDYVMGKRDPDTGEILDFAGIEIQALDTTGKVWDHKMAYEDGRDIEDVEDSYGMNWAMSITKTMMQQAWKKGQAFQEWGENIIFLLQDVSMEYLRQNANTTRLEDAKVENPVHFYSYSLDYDYNDKEYNWSVDEKLSSDLEGVSQMMDSSEDDVPPTSDEFKKSINDKI